MGSEALVGEQQMGSIKGCAWSELGGTRLSHETGGEDGHRIRALEFTSILHTHSGCLLTNIYEARPCADTMPGAVNTAMTKTAALDFLFFLLLKTIPF